MARLNIKPLGDKILIEMLESSQQNIGAMIDVKDCYFMADYLTNGV